MKYILVVCCFLLFLNPVIAQNAIEKAIAVLDNDTDIEHGDYGFYAIDVETGTVVGKRNERESFIPASSLKIVTTGTALAMLGKDYKFKTELQYDGKLENGVLKGNIYIKGYGDPTLGSGEPDGVMTFKQLTAAFVKAIKEKGIKEINGDIVGDATFFNSNDIPDTWEWDDLGNYYAAQASGLNINENQYSLFFKQAKEGDSPIISRMDPEVPDFRITSQVVSEGSRDGANIIAPPFAVSAVVKGSIPAGNGTEYSIKGSIPDPAKFAAFHLRKTLVESGISCKGDPTTAWKVKSNGPKTTFYTLESPSLLKIITRANHESINLYCEVLLKLMALKKKGKAGVELGITTVKEFWADRGIAQEGWNLEDGSGLSPRNTITAKHLAEILRKLYIDSTSFSGFYESLPLVGKAGTVKNLCKDNDACGNCRVKSGSMKKVRSYSGYVKNKEGKMIAFSIIVNHFGCSDREMRKKLEKIILALRTE